MYMNRFGFLIFIAAVMPATLKAQSNTFIGKIVEANTNKGVP